jgi:hypothetical protein
MKIFKYILIIIGLLGGILMSFIEFEPMDSLDENFEPVINLNYDIVVHILYPYGIIYALIGGISGFSLWLIFLCLIGLVKRR